MDPEFGIPGLGTYTAPGWQGASEATYTPASAEAAAGARTPSQVPGTSGAPSDYTPSATPGGVSTGPAPAHRARLLALSLVASPAVAALGLSILDY